MKKLILAEKPSLGKKIASALGVTGRNSNGHFENDDIIVAWLVGHVIEAKYPKIEWNVDNLPLSLENPKMVPSSGKKELVGKIKKEVVRSDVTEIVNAGDADTEGSLLVYELYEYFNILDSGKKFTRMWILAEDSKTINKAYKDRYSQDEDMKFVNAGKSRGLADVRLGFNFSRLYTLKHNKYGESFAIGRVMTPTMQIVRTREVDIENFIPEDYWTIKGDFSKGGSNFKGDLFYINDENKQSTSLNKEQFEKYKADIAKGDEYVVKSKTVKNNKKKPDFLPNLNDILKSMSKFHKMNSKKTTSIMQDLYESQYCTYPRSEVKFLPTSMEKEVLEVFDCYEGLCSKELSGEPTNYSVKNKRVFDDKKVGSHFAIIPMVKSQAQIDKLDSDHKKVFDYIVSKFVMAFMNDYEYESTLIVLKKDENTFKINGKIERKKGYKNFDCVSNKNSAEDVIVPEISEGDLTTLEAIESKKNKTKPPAVITELTLLEIMENVHKLYKKQKHDEDEEAELEHDGAFSLGTPATRGGIIEKLLKLKYLKKSGQKFVVTEFGIKLLDTAEGSLNIETTATFEEDMANIISDKEDSTEFDKKMEEYVNSIINGEVDSIRETAEKAAEEMKTGLDCPICDGDINAMGKAYRCSNSGTYDKKKKEFSGCQFCIIKYVKPLDYTINHGDLKMLLNKEPVEVNGKKLVYDENSKFFVKMELPKTDENCPECGENIIENDKVYRCSAAGSWDAKKKSFSGCQFCIIKYVKPLDYSITKPDLKMLLNKEPVEVGGKKLVFDQKSKFYVQIEMPKAGLECPLCSAECNDTGKGYRCSKSGSWDPKKKSFTGCKFNVMKHIKPLKWDMSKEDLSKMIGGEVIEVDGKKVSFDKKNQFFINIDFGGGSGGNSGLDIKCPSCKGDMLDAGKMFRCKNTGKWSPKKKGWDGKCKITIFKGNRKLGRDLTTDDLKELFAGNSVGEGGNAVKLDLKNKYLIV